MIVGTEASIPSIKDMTAFFPASTIFCILSPDNELTRFSWINFPTSGNVCKSRGTISPNPFSTFFPAVTIDSARASGDPVPFRKLSKAPFADAIEPDIVSDASFAVVPVIPISVWTM